MNKNIWSVKIVWKTSLPTSNISIKPINEIRSLQYVTEKERGIHKRLIMSSITIYHVILTYIIRGVLISLIGFIEILLVGKLVFHTILTDKNSSNNICKNYMIYCNRRHN